jgi:hypothetical protein
MSIEIAAALAPAADTVYVCEQTEGEGEKKSRENALVYARDITRSNSERTK